MAKQLEEYRIERDIALNTMGHPSLTEVCPHSTGSRGALVLQTASLEPSQRPGRRVVEFLVTFRFPRRHQRNSASGYGSCGLMRYRSYIACLVAEALGTGA